MMNTLKFYFLGHNYEYEARNALRVFDLNIGCEIMETHRTKTHEGLELVSYLNECEGIYSGSAWLYSSGVLLYESEFKSGDILMESESEKKLKKTLVIKSIHDVLKSYYGDVPDYGILTGVRVVKIMIIARKHGRTDDEIVEILRNTYEVTDDKIKLLWDILSIEEKYMDFNGNNKNYNLYIGIPFCPTRCSYCSFTSYVNSRNDKINEYIELLTYETEETIKMAIKSNMKLNSLYIGGGTPSVLNEEQINKIFDVIRKYYDLQEIKEVTFEAGRPDTLTEEKLICLKNNGVGRISINPQTMNENTLQKIGRRHSIQDIVNKYELARKTGFECINMDVILGLPGEDEKDAENTIEEILRLRPDNITVHSLAYKKKSELTRESEEYNKDYDIIKKMHEVVNQRCQAEGYKPYYMYRQKNIKGNSENTGFTLVGRESIYNMVIIEELETILACGLGASSKIKISDDRHEPVRNFKSLEEYKSRIGEIIDKKRELLKMKEE